MGTHNQCFDNNNNNNNCFSMKYKVYYRKKKSRNIIRYEMYIPVSQYVPVKPVPIQLHVNALTPSTHNPF